MENQILHVLTKQQKKRKRIAGYRVGLVHFKVNAHLKKHWESVLGQFLQALCKMVNSSIKAGLQVPKNFEVHEGILHHSNATAEKE